MASFVAKMGNRGGRITWYGGDKVVLGETVDYPGWCAMTTGNQDSSRGHMRMRGHIQRGVSGQFVADAPLLGIPYAALRAGFAPITDSMYARYNAAGWIEKDPGDDPPAASDLLFNFGGILFHLIDYNVAGVGGSIIRRSLDNGETWDDLTVPGVATFARDLVRDSAGRLMLLLEDAVAPPAQGHYHIYSSLDNGDSWALYRTADLKALGGLDTSLPGGDDIDLSIRVKGLGKRLIAERRAYVHHHGSVTGRREHGSD